MAWNALEFGLGHPELYGRPKLKPYPSDLPFLRTREQNRELILIAMCLRFQLIECYLNDCVCQVHGRLVEFH